MAWQYYWPNVYEVPEIVETWRSLAKILATADTVIQVMARQSRSTLTYCGN